MNSIVVPVNFSECAGNAARYAADLSSILHTDLRLIHVVQVPVTSAEMTMTEFVYQEMVDSANTALKELQADLVKRTSGRINVKTTLDAGSVTGKVNELCKQLNPYAVVVGVSEPSLEKMLAGSPVSSLLNNIPYPVLIVPGNTRFERFRHIVLSCDLEDIGSGISRALPLLKDLRMHFGTRFDVITVETKKILNREHSIFESDAWKNQLKELYPENHFIHGSTVEEGLLHYLNEHEADLVIVFPKKHRLLEFHVSQSRKIAKHSPIPVLSVH